MAIMKNHIIINEKDNVAVALKPLSKGEAVCDSLVLADDIPQGHKFAIRDISPDEEIIKYGNPIGKATSFISKGAHVHVHNIKTCLREGIGYSYCPPGANRDAQGSLKNSSEASAKAESGCAIPKTFNGYYRSDGRVGTRNEIWIIPTVGCVNNVAEAIESLAKSLFEKHDEIDAIVAFTHPYGCSQLGDDQENTRKILADLCCHPNAGGILLIGLGCENSSVEVIKNLIPDFDSRPIKTLICQDVPNETEEGTKLVGELISDAAKAKRQPVPLSKLVAGVKCGGSDGLSGITANPLVGSFTDALVGLGGSVIMSEVPEMFGAEQLLMNRAENEEVYEKIVKMIDDFKGHYSSNNLPIYENPSPGNKAGGISTLEDKSLGCTQKSGSATVKSILKYGERLEETGFALLTGPGNDLVSATALAASGAQIILFTTGRGTPFGAPVPTLKISSNTRLCKSKNHWIDFNAGIIVDEDAPPKEQIQEDFFKLIIETASGKPVKSEISGFHDMAILKQGVTL